MDWHENAGRHDNVGAQESQSHPGEEHEDQSTHGQQAGGVHLCDGALVEHVGDEGDDAWGGVRGEVRGEGLGGWVGLGR